MKNILPKKGQIAIAEYLLTGKVQKQLELGVVTKVTKTYFEVEKDGVKTKRSYSYGVTNGIRLKCFKDKEG